ncbi:PilX N-terminal domain-containing pilus assembly protein [Neptuniibacter sp. CAU 1671]|uniref:general secretion pathway protein GspK n=1 Tax=Neptuniibacter sp. CAU 1671 TaxID=3032593 RepID=UPI0023DC61D5|nr:PilX N-terminal domain-containing pilus assembly protein [Neptuniibacter sp. CAU 1671]MDF2180732.1 type II secretion system protein GspK [Neptuniibacter sp. CAU 1671]
MLTNKARQRGIALVMVLWFLVLLSVIALYLSDVSRSEARLTENLRAATQASYGAESGVQWAIWNLTLPQGQGWLADGGWQKMQLDEALSVMVSVEDENGKFDLNTLQAEQFQRLFLAATIDEEKANILIDRILDWRDKDDLKRLNGAEDADYRAAGLDYEARDDRFKRVDELKQVLGMDIETYEKIAPALSVYARSQGINPLVAPKLVLMSLPAANEPLIDQYIEQRRRFRLDGLPEPTPPVSDARFISSSTSGVYYTVRTEGRLYPHARVGQKVLLQRSGRGSEAYFRVMEIVDERSSIKDNCDEVPCSEED